MIEVELPEEPIVFKAVEHTGTHVISLIATGQNSAVRLARESDARTE